MGAGLFTVQEARRADEVVLRWQTRPQGRMVKALGPSILNGHAISSSRLFCVRGSGKIYQFAWGVSHLLSEQTGRSAGQNCHPACSIDSRHMRVPVSDALPGNNI